MEFTVVKLVQALVQIGLVDQLTNDLSIECSLAEQKAEAIQYTIRLLFI